MLEAIKNTLASFSPQAGIQCALNYPSLRSATFWTPDYVEDDGRNCQRLEIDSFNPSRLLSTDNGKHNAK